MNSRGTEVARRRSGVGKATAQPVAGADLAVENSCEAGLVFEALQVKFGDTASAARRLSSTVRRPNISSSSLE